MSSRSRQLLAATAGLAMLAAACGSTTPESATSNGMGGGTVDRDTFRWAFDAEDGTSAATFDAATGPTRSEVIAASGNEAVPANLARFDDCGAFLGHIRAKAWETVTPYGLPGQGGFGGPVIMEGDVAMADGAASAAAGGRAANESSALPQTDSAGADGYSTTNVQVEGVDEPDIVKTDGKSIFASIDNRVRVIRASTGKVIATIELPAETWAGNLVLHDDRLLVISQGQRARAPQPANGQTADRMAQSDVAYPGDWQPQTTLSLYDVSDAAKPKLQATTELDGTVVDGRSIGATGRFVMSTGPQNLVWSYPDGKRNEEQALAANRETVTKSTAANWLPTFRYTDVRDNTTASGVYVNCNEVYEPPEYSGLGLLSVVTVDLADGLRPAESSAVLSDGQTIYANAEHLYVATARWFDPAAVDGGQTNTRFAPPQPGQVTTALHRFSISGDGPAAYEASGRVRGTVLNQFSMSEEKGVLRIATTDGQPWFGPDSTSESFVTTFRRDAKVLTKVGQVGGLGKGETIQSVRFIGDLGYVVTFRQTDPLYVVDLSDPAKPTVKGELKILGFSAYLHPIGKGLLLGVGQDATAEGRTTGTQLSIFDVSDSSNPRRTAQRTIADSNSSAQFDHHAFLWWAPTGLAMIPLEQWSQTGQGGQQFSGAVGFTVKAPGSITELGRVSHEAPQKRAGGTEPGRADEERAIAADEPYGGEWHPPVLRSLVIGNEVVTISPVGVERSSLATLAELSYTTFG